SHQQFQITNTKSPTFGGSSQDKTHQRPLQFTTNVPFSPKLSLGQNSEVILMENIYFFWIYFDLMKAIFDDPCDGFLY
ncbi:MAG: hypothetical protein ACI9TO_001203, partial [Rickettsiales bacterium]